MRTSRCLCLFLILLVASACSHRVVATKYDGEIRNKTFTVMPVFDKDVPVQLQLQKFAEMALLDNGYRVVRYCRLYKEVKNVTEYGRKGDVNDGVEKSKLFDKSMEQSADYAKEELTYRDYDEPEADYALDLYVTNRSIIKLRDKTNGLYLGTVDCKNDFESIHRAVGLLLQKAGMGVSSIHYDATLYRPGVINHSDTVTVIKWKEEDKYASYVENSLVEKGLKVVHSKLYEYDNKISASQREKTDKVMEKKNREVKYTSRFTKIDADIYVESSCGIEKTDNNCAVRFTRAKNDEVVGIVVTDENKSRLRSRINSALEILSPGF